MKKIALLIIPWLVLTSFFWSDDEEKQLRALHQSAELAIKKEDFGEAKDSYEQLIRRIGVNTTQKYSVDWTTYVDVVMRFAEACEATGEMLEGERALSNLLKRNPPEEQIPRIKLMRARLTANQKSPGDAFLEMGEVVKQLQVNKWRKEDLTFYHALEYSLDSQYDQLMRKAKRYLVTGYYAEAIALYEEILEAIKLRHYPKAEAKDSLIEKTIHYRLAESHYSQANYEQTLALCYNEKVVEDRIDREMIYLSALCYQEKKEYVKALECFQNYTNYGEELDHFDHALFEIGFFYYQAGNYEQARLQFERLQDFAGKPKRVAALYLARIHLQEGKPEKVEENIAPISENLSDEDPLRFECYYLRGEAAYALNDYEKAKDFFEQSLPGSTLSGEWTKQALFHLGWCCIHLGEAPQEDQKVRSGLFCKAEKIFGELLKSKEKEAAALALGRVYLLRWYHFDDPGSLTLVAPLLLPYKSIEAFLMRAEAALGYVGKENLLIRATDERFCSHPAYADAWYERGLNHFQEGLKTPENGSRCFELAAIAFANSFRYCEQQETPKAAQILKLEAKANAHRNSPISSLALLEKLLTQFTESVEEREETLYLRGLIASRLPDSSYFSVAEESLQAVAEGQGRYRNDALYVLGTLYYRHEAYAKAKKIFSNLAFTEPTSPFTSDALFFAAEAAEKIGDITHIKLRAHVYNDYPDSPKAAEAYFRQYSYDSYLEGDVRALAHLRTFPTRFPHSEILVVVHYLIGMNEEKFVTAKRAFEEAIKAFPTGFTPDSALIYFRYQAMLELAELHLNNPSSEPELALHLLQAIVNDFSDRNHSLTSLLTQKEPYPSIFEKSEFALARAYIKCGKKLRAQERLSKMLAHFDEAGIQEGYYLSQVWFEQGKLAGQCQDHTTAIRCYEIAGECGQSYLSEEEKLSLWLLMSHAYRGKREYDKAMRLLSKVINTDIPSPLRLKAMFYRAEIYELQGRPELAVRQLEAMSRKGGDWALEAQEKLRLEYGM